MRGRQPWARLVLTDGIHSDPNVALNESRFLSVQVDRAVRSAMVWFEVLTSPEEGPGPVDTVAREFNGSQIYGWEFVDPPVESWADWRERLSLDEVLSTEAADHVLELFQIVPG